MATRLARIGAPLSKPFAWLVALFVPTAGVWRKVVDWLPDIIGLPGTGSDLVTWEGWVEDGSRWLASSVASPLGWIVWVLAVSFLAWSYVQHRRERGLMPSAPSLAHINAAVEETRKEANINLQAKHDLIEFVREYLIG